MIQTLGLSPPTREQRAVTPNSPSVPLSSPLAFSFLSLGSEDSGEVISPQSAMAQATVNACVTLLSTGLASATPRLYERVGRGRVEAYSNPLHTILARSPNPESTSFTLWSSFYASALLHGNGFIEIQRDGSNVVQGLWFLPATSMTVVRQSDGTLVYRTTEGMDPGQYRQLQPSQVLHLPAHFSADGVMGVSPIGQCRLAVGGAIQMDRFNDRFFRSNATPSGVLTVKAKMKPEDKQLVKVDWQNFHSGSNQHQVAILDQEMIYVPLSTSQADAEFISSRKMSREEICGIFGLKTSQIASESRISSETYGGQQLSYLTDCLLPWLLKTRQILESRLLVGQPTQEIVMDTSERLKLDFKTQMDGFSVARVNGIMTASECRHELSLDPGGPECDLFTLPAQQISASRLLDPPTPTTTTGVENV